LLNSLLNCFRKGVKVVNEKPQGQALCSQTEPVGEVTQRLFYFPLQSVSGIFDEEADGNIQISARSAQGIVNGTHRDERLFKFLKQVDEFTRSLDGPRSTIHGGW
jgi:hypothetical protein